MTSTGEETPLTVEEALDIMGQAQRFGVTELKFRGLALRFGEIPTPGTPEHNIEVETPAAEIAEKQRDAAKDALILDEARIKERQLDQMFIEDPMQAEELLAEGDLTDDEREEEEA